MRLKEKNHTYFLWLGILALFAVSFLSFGTNLVLSPDYGWRLAMRNFIDRSFDLSGAKSFNPLEVSTNLIKATVKGKYPVQIDSLRLDIKFKHFEKIFADRQKAIKNSILSNPATIPAKIRYMGKSYKAKIRLKGDLESHWLGPNRWSFRVKLTGGENIKGFTQFSIQRPSARQFPYDNLFQNWGRMTGNMTPKYDYARIFVNGDHWGIMAIEEHMSKSMVELNDRKDAPLLKVGSEDRWYYNMVNQELKNTPKVFYPGNQVSLYNEKKYRNDPYKRQLFSYASSEIRKIQEAHYDDTGFLDQESFSKAFHLASIWNEFHTLADANSRYYLNPYTLKLEVITTDQSHFSAIEEISKTYSSISSIPFYKSIISSEAFSRIQSVVLLDFPKYLDQMQEQHLDLCKIFPLDCPTFDISALKTNVGKLVENKHQHIEQAMTSIREINNGKSGVLSDDVKDDLNVDYPRHINAEHYENGRLNVYNLLSRPVIIEAIKLYCTKKADKDCIDRQLLTKPIELTASQLNNLNYAEINTGPVILDGKRAIRIRTNRNGVQKTLKVSLSRASNLFNPIREKKWQLANDNWPEWLIKNKNSYRVKSGNWYVDQPIVFPKESPLFIEKGTTINFGENAYFIFQSPVQAIGTPQAPIVLRPIKNNWQGLYFLRTGGKSEFENVNIKNTNFLKDGVLQLTGAVTFYESDVTIRNSSFSGTLAEDALNIVRSNFDIKSSLFENSASDAFDSDFSNGKISNTRFKNLGGDGLDTSGSGVVVENLEFYAVKDKAISAGESSNLKISVIKSDKVGTTLAVKDGSIVSAKNLRITNPAYRPVMVYMKKPIYGPARLEIEDTNISENQFFNQEGNQLVANGQSISGQPVNVDKLYKTETMKK